MRCLLISLLILLLYPGEGRGTSLQAASLSDAPEKSSALEDSALRIARMNAELKTGEISGTEAMPAISETKKPVEEKPILLPAATPKAKAAIKKPVSLVVVPRKPIRQRPLLMKSIGLRFVFLVISLSIIIVTVVFYRSRSEKHRFMTTTRLSIMDKEVQRACRFIEANFSDPELSIERICAELVTGSAFLQALFEKELGLKVEDFLNQVRINKSKLLMTSDPQVEIQQVAMRSGFKDPNVFLDTFRRITGSTVDEFKGTIASLSTAE